MKNIAKFVMAVFLTVNSFLFISDNVSAQELTQTINFNVNNVGTQVQTSTGGASKILFITSKKDPADTETFKKIQNIVNELPKWKPQNVVVGLTIIDKYNKGYGLQSDWNTDVTNLNNLLSKGIQNGFANLLEKSFYPNGTSLEKPVKDYLGDDIKNILVVVSGVYKDYGFLDHALKNAYHTIVVADSDDKAHIDKLGLQNKNYTIIDSLDQANLQQYVGGSGTTTNVTVNIDIVLNQSETITKAVVIDPSGTAQNLPLQGNTVHTVYTPNQNGNYKVQYNYKSPGGVTSDKTRVQTVTNNQGQVISQDGGSSVNHPQGTKAELYIVGVDEDNKELYRELVSNSLTVGGQITISPKEVFGYAAQDSSFQYTVKEPSDVYTFKYKAKTGSVTIRHLDPNGSILKEEVIKKNEKFGTQWTYQPPKEYEDKKLVLSSEYKNDGKIDGTISTENDEYVFKYVDKDGSTESSSDKIISSPRSNGNLGSMIMIGSIIGAILIGLGIILILNWKKIFKKKNQDEDLIEDDKEDQ